jgi:hypothetical protein
MVKIFQVRKDHYARELVIRSLSSSGSVDASIVESVLYENSTFVKLRISRHPRSADSGVRTAMIYIHVLNRGGKGVISPADDLRGACYARAETVLNADFWQNCSI